MAKEENKIKKTVLKELKSLKNEKAQTSVEVILLIGSILVISLISGTYVLRINQEISELFRETLDKGRENLLNKL
ncbi:class III signal peptide-containing protein [uncultured Methanobrevibacter sp.]|uniref:class III signal peptide-containing protein n=1 Tax=uncultured Methanobrevibacter sp. TaxID=253161 RepID=UPI00261029C1